ncbi:F-box only protein 34, partial [Silurus meridionalis]
PSVFRVSAMHLKSYPKPQNKEVNQDRGQDDTGNLVGQRGVLRSEWGVRQACSLMVSPGNGTVNRCPLSVISTNTLRYTTNGSTTPSRASGRFSQSWCHKSKTTSSSVTAFTNSLMLLSSSAGMENEGSVGIYQGEDGEGSLDIWAVIKPGNTKEKIAIFTAQKCSHVAASSNDEAFEKEEISTELRTVSMKSKGCWDGDWSLAKRRKRSGNLEKSRCITPPAQKPEFCTALLTSTKNSNPSGEIVKTDEEEGGKTISVVEMVAYLEQRASDQHVAPKRPSLRSSSTITLSKALSLLPPAEQLAKGPQLSEVQEEEESVRVLDMVAKLESQCLSRQSAREGGDLSRNNSLRRRVGRVLLAGSEPYSAALLGLPQDNRKDSHPEQVTSDVDKPRSPAEACVPVHSVQFALGGQKVVEQETCVKVDTINSLCILTNQSSSEPHECSVEPLPGMLFFAHTPPQAPQEQRCYFISNNISISQNAKDSSNEPKKEQTGEPSQKQALEVSPTDVSIRDNKLENKWEDDHNSEETEEECNVNNRDPVPLRRLVSHEFLETRFKIQLLLEPQQYMAFMPHHIIVKIFGLLPTESLAALKCTCHFFKFIIESYGVRPADSRWVSDPRYKDDPCKQCKKRYGRGDVSLCRWHHKPYCQALPYGPGYWMCCRGAHKDTPGCNVGLHDNRWVPAFHSINMPIYKKSRDSEND